MNTETESTHHLLQQEHIVLTVFPVGVTIYFEKFWADHLDQNEVIVRTELIYFRESHKSEVLYNPELFKVNGKPTTKDS